MSQVTDTPSSSPLVWVRVGSNQHLAKLVSCDETEATIEWAVTGDLETVERTAVEYSRTPRQRRPLHQEGEDSPSPSKKSKPELPKKPPLIQNDSALAATPGAQVLDCSAEESDSDVEFLFTCPSSDSTPRLSVCTPNCFLKDTASAESNEDVDVVPRKELTLQQNLDQKAVALPGNKAEVSTEMSEALECENSEKPSIEDVEEGTAQSQYTFSSSAYVQNLAEICDTILHDARWRVSTFRQQQQALFRWENGDDLSVVTELSRYHKDEDGNDASARAVYLYCRLYYRKGPWYRIDDVYNRYYAPRRSSSDTSTEQEEGEHSDPQHFFRQRPSVNEGKAKRNEKEIIDEKQLEESKVCLNLLLMDLHQLQSLGRVRSFQDERECGETVGRSLLRADERKAVLGKLGARKNAVSTAHENVILKQMTQQQTLFAHFQPNNDGLLPVQKHVDQVVIQRLATSVVQACSVVEYLPAAVLRDYCDQIVAFINHRKKEIVRDCSTKQKALLTCFRLREAPLLALQRCSRLFLCATSGPGSMRNDGGSAWRSLAPARPEERPPLARIIPPPNISSWSRVDYPGLLVRFGRSSAPFSRAYVPLPVSEDRPLAGEHIEIFYSAEAFAAWEVAVELRANVDYLIELHERLRYEQRRRDRDEEKKNGSSSSVNNTSTATSVDYLNLLQGEGWGEILHVFLTACSDGAHSPSSLLEEIALHQDHLRRDIEQCVSTFASECEKVLGCLGSLILFVLRVRHRSISMPELESIRSRPWLRHTFWDGCIGYILWDILPYFEKQGLFRLAIQSLQVLVYGKVDERTTIPVVLSPTALAPLLLSRRARGKALERIVIDYSHLNRKERGKEEEGNSKKETVASRQRRSKLLAEGVASFCESVIQAVAAKGSVSFAAIRCLAKRLKRPLTQTLSCTHSIEAQELGFRLCNDSDVSGNEDAKAGYSDWTPITDRSIANAITTDEKEKGVVGGRCAFVGFEECTDQHRMTMNPGSLNVEELAMDYYRTGRLPAGDLTNSVRGGWHGWHDEGGKIRALFRILCASDIFGMNWSHVRNDDSTSQYSIHISPYQSAPFDLHVGYELQSSQDGARGSPTKGFYYRRQEKIKEMLDQLNNCTDQEISDRVYNAVCARLDWTISQNIKDPHLQMDLLQLRSLCAVAAGCGGKQLAAAFRCLFFDYRHFSGGLPDLFLFRVLYDDKELQESENRLVNLGEFIGERFTDEHRQSVAMQQAIAMVSDRDDDFLGCSKVGDSGGRVINRPKRRHQQLGSQTLDEIPLKMPERLALSHNGRPVKVECLLVEVKSANDRLDPRQEDWLNVLDRSGGNARVCKFESTSSKSRKAPARKSSSR